MKKLWGILLLAVFVLTSHSAYAMSGNELVDNMRENQKMGQIEQFSAWKAGKYLGYVSGVFEATWTDYALPKNITLRQVCSVVDIYLEKHPEKWNEQAAYLVRQALLEAFPKR